MIPIISINLLAIIFAVTEGFVHWHFAEQLECMIYKSDSDEINGKFHKGAWHFQGALSRLSVGAILTLGALLYTNEVYLVSLQVAIILYLIREIIPNGFEIKQTCEKWYQEDASVLQKIMHFDWDCPLIWLRDKLGINFRYIVLISYILTVVYLILK